MKDKELEMLFDDAQAIVEVAIREHRADSACATMHRALESIKDAINVRTVDYCGFGSWQMTFIPNLANLTEKINLEGE